MPGGVIGAIKRVGGEAQVHGVLYLWKGVYTNLLRDISFSALPWLMYFFFFHLKIDWNRLDLS